MTHVVTNMQTNFHKAARLDHGIGDLRSKAAVQDRLTENTGNDISYIVGQRDKHGRDRQRERVCERENEWEFLKWEQSIYCFILHRKEEKEEKS